MRLRMCLCLRVRLCGWRKMRDLRRLLGLAPEPGLPPGTYKYDGSGSLAGHRYHLRVDGKRKGVLLIDASKLVFLNGTALDYTRGLLEGWDEDRVVRYMRSRYRNLERSVAKDHLARIGDQLGEFLSGRPDVIQSVGAEIPTIGADELPSPYRMDLALTYRCQNRCLHCYNETREVKEMGSESWLRVIDRLWEIGIPHLVFTGGEPTLVPFLPSLMARSEEHGQITGMISNGRRLAEEGYLHNLVEAGLDHVQVTILSHRASLHDELTGLEGSWNETIEGIKVALEEDVYLSTNTTLLRENLGEAEETLRYLISLGVRNICINGLIRSGRGREARGVSYDQIESTLVMATALAEEKGVNLVWYTPTPYCEFNPINYGLGIKQCTACSLNMAVEPDGSVLPCQSYYEPLGNILTDPWDSIWNHRLCREVRNRDYLPEKCVQCNLSDVCGGGCPLAYGHEEYICLDRHSSM
jgi:radical SAM protein with 4Fe4S-binding SPASM domain